MIIKDLLKIDGLKLLNNPDDLTREIKDLYTSDLLSWVMGHVREEGTVLLTVLNTINAVAVATLLDMPAIIFCEKVVPTADILKKADEENIAIFSSMESTFHTAKEIVKNESLL